MKISGLLKKHNIEAGDTVIDIGSCKGKELKDFINAGIKVISFEPHPDLYSKLKLEYGDNSLVILHEVAAWNKNGTAKMWLCSNHDEAGSSLISGKNNLSKLAVDILKVKTVDMGRFCNGSVPIKLMKIDAEGAEYIILDRLLDTDAIKNIEHIYVEDHERKINDPKWRSHKKSVQKKLKKQGIVVHNWHHRE